jgi:hypothetical protein
MMSFRSWSFWSCHGCGSQWQDDEAKPCDCEPLKSVYVAGCAYPLPSFSARR